MLPKFKEEDLIYDKVIRTDTGDVLQHIISGKHLGILYSIDETRRYVTLHKIGELISIQNIYVANKEKYDIMKGVGETFEIFSVPVDNITQEEVDKIFQNTGYLKVFLEREGLL